PSPGPPGVTPAALGPPRRAPPRHLRPGGARRACEGARDRGAAPRDPPALARGAQGESRPGVRLDPPGGRRGHEGRTSPRPALPLGRRAGLLRARPLRTSPRQPHLDRPARRAGGHGEPSRPRQGPAPESRSDLSDRRRVHSPRARRRARPGRRRPPRGAPRPLARDDLAGALTEGGPRSPRVTPAPA